MAIIASFLMGANGATTLNGGSTELSTPADRERFLARHRSASAFIIGKNSAKVESYAASHVPVFVLSRDPSPLLLPHPLMQQIKVDGSLLNTVQELIKRIDGDIVVEAGAELMKALINEGLIDQLELTISPIAGDGHFVDQGELLYRFTIVRDIEIDGTRLIEGRYQSDSTNS